MLGGAAAWENVDTTDGETVVTSINLLGLILGMSLSHHMYTKQETCPKCEHPKAYFMQMQTRSADEPMTIFFKCCNPDCDHRWKE